MNEFFSYRQRRLENKPGRIFGTPIDLMEDISGPFNNDTPTVPTDCLAFQLLRQIKSKILKEWGWRGMRVVINNEPLSMKQDVQPH